MLPKQKPLSYTWIEKEANLIPTIDLDAAIIHPACLQSGQEVLNGPHPGTVAGEGGAEGGVDDMADRGGDPRTRPGVPGDEEPPLPRGGRQEASSGEVARVQRRPRSGHRRG